MADGSRIEKVANVATIRRIVAVLLASILILSSWGGIYAAHAGLKSRTFAVEGIPMQFMAPQKANQLPGVLVAHGFSGSKQLMLGYAHVLAHNGYGVLLWDLSGHGANTQPFAYDKLQQGFDVALSALQEQPEINSQQLAALGHSMGGGVVLRGSMEHGDQIGAVVAISSTEAPVTPSLPKNLSLQLGEWESYLLPYAQQLLRQAGGAESDVSEGRGRELLVVPSVEHTTILFSDISHQAALTWLNKTFDRSSSNSYKDRRMAWYGLHLLGWLILIATVLTPSHQVFSWSVKPLRSWGGLILSPIVALLSLILVHLRVDAIDQLGGLQIGGALGLWMLLAGVAWLGVLTVRTSTLPRPKAADIQRGMVGFAMLWCGIGALSQWVWLPWFLVPPRLLLWAVITVACIPWFLASGLVQDQTKMRYRIGWWLGQSFVLVLGLGCTIATLPSLGFLAILLPLFPIVIGLFTFMAAKLESPWAYCCACAPMFSWLIVTPFPLV